MSVGERKQSIREGRFIDRLIVRRGINQNQESAEFLTWCVCDLCQRAVEVDAVPLVCWFSDGAYMIAGCVGCGDAADISVCA